MMLHNLLIVIRVAMLAAKSVGASWHDKSTRTFIWKLPCLKAWCQVIFWMSLADIWTLKRNNLNVDIFTCTWEFHPLLNDADWLLFPKAWLEAWKTGRLLVNWLKCSLCTQDVLKGLGGFWSLKIPWTFNWHCYDFWCSLFRMKRIRFQIKLVSFTCLGSIIVVS